MKLKSVKVYLFELISDAHYWQYTDINGIGKKPRLYFSSFQIIFLVLSISLSLSMDKNFNKDFVGYLMATLSIFIGMFLTIIISMFDKFQNINFPTSEKDRELMSHDEENSLVQIKNFFKKFTALTFYSIIISILCILFLCLSFINQEVRHCIFDYTFICNIEELTKDSILIFFTLLGFFIYRLLTIYFLFNFFLMIIYSITSFHRYTKINYDKIKIRK